MVQFELITGFLGSGKTTLLSRLLGELTPHKRIAVIQNEFAPSGIDGKILKQDYADFKLIEINNGSVFCVCQLGNFVQAMAKLIHAYNPEIIFLEASGLSDPINIIELLQSEGLKGKVSLGRSICVVDSVNFFKGLKTLTRFKHQIMIADVIVLNRTDLFHGDLDEIVSELGKLNPYAEVISTAYGNVAYEKLSGIDREIGMAAERYRGIDSQGKPNMNACVLRTHEKIGRSALKAFLETMEPSCPRIKGFVNLAGGGVAAIQLVFGKIEMHTMDHYQGTTEIIAFGKNLEVNHLRKTFRQFAAS